MDQGSGALQLAEQPRSLSGLPHVDRDSPLLQHPQRLGRVVDDQNDIAAYETATEGYTFVNAALAWRPLHGNASITLMLKADNIFDVTARRHTSVTNDFVPLAGRNFSASIRASF